MASSLECLATSISAVSQAASNGRVQKANPSAQRLKESPMSTSSPPSSPLLPRVSRRSSSHLSTSLTSLVSDQNLRVQRSACRATGGDTVSTETADSSLETSTPPPPPPTAGASPFAGQKISALLAARAAAAASQAAPAAAEAAPAPTAATPSPPPSPFVSAQSPFAPPSAFSQTLNPVATPSSGVPKAIAPKPATQPPAVTPAARLSSVNAVPSAAVKPTVSFRGKALVDALREQERSVAGGKKAVGAQAGEEKVAVRVGAPKAPSDLFEDRRRTPAEVEAEAWKFAVSPDQLLLALSFFATSAIMMLTVFVVG